jgi:hypothetical protein
VVAVRRGRKNAEPRAKLRVGDEPAHEPTQAVMDELPGEELEEPVQLVDVAPRLGNELAGIGFGGLERAHLELESVTEPLDPAQHAHGVSFPESAVEELDVVPHARLDASARIDELEGEVRASRACAEAALASDRVEPLDDPILGELGDRHAAILGPSAAGSLRLRWPS